MPISKLHPILAVVNLLAHNNLWLYMVLWASKIATAKFKYSIVLKWASKRRWGYHLFCW